MKSILNLSLLFHLARLIHARSDDCSPPPSSSWSRQSWSEINPAFVTPSSPSARRLLPPPSPTSRKDPSSRFRDISSVFSLFSSKTDHRPDTQRFNNLIYATDDTVQLLRDELKSRLLKAAEEFSAAEVKNSSISSMATEPITTPVPRREGDEGTYVIRLVHKIVRKIMRRRLPDSATSARTQTSQPQLQHRGGILSSESFRQTKLEVGDIGKRVIEIAEQLSLLNPTPIPTLGFKHYGGAEPKDSKLNGNWKLRFTTAADASFPESEKRGAVTTSQIIDAEEGTLTNVVDFEKGNLKGFRVVVQGEPVSETTIRLSFKKVKLLRQSRFPRLFGEITIRLPSRLIRWLGSRKDEEVDDQNIGPYLRLRYLDDDLRMHTTNTGNWFIQTRL